MFFFGLVLWRWEWSFYHEEKKEVGNLTKENEEKLHNLENQRATIEAQK